MAYSGAMKLFIIATGIKWLFTVLGFPQNTVFNVMRSPEM